MKVLLVGGSGYIGATLAPFLLAAGHHVTVYDLCWFGQYTVDNPRFNLLKRDTRDTAWFSMECRRHDAIIYLAGLTKDSECEKRPGLAFEVNVSVFPKMVDLALSGGIKRFIYASSVAAYGSHVEARNEAHPLVPESIYGRHKTACEAILRCVDPKRMCWTITRAASVYGESVRMRFDLMVNRMVRDMCFTGKINVNGGDRERSHVSIYDLCDFYRLLLDVGESRIAGQTYNVVSESQTILQTAKTIAKALDKKPEIVEAPADNARTYRVVGLKAKKELNWTPKHSIPEGVPRIEAGFLSGRWKDALTSKTYENELT